MLKWVKLKKYCEASGDTSNAVHCKPQRGMWLDGLHSRLILMVHSEGLEPPTPWFEAKYSIQLSYERIMMGR